MSPASFGCRSMVRLWSSPPTFPSWMLSRSPRSSRNCAALTSIRRGGCCLTCRSGSCTSHPTKNATGLLPCMSRMTTVRVGVSAAFKDLRDTPRALHVARVMLRGPTDSTSSVAVFDGSILATAAVSAPEVMIKTVGAALDGFGDLPDEDREMLFETFRVWQDNDASVRGAAEVLICHPNTVRHRLRRIEKHTGRSLSRPRDIAELCLAFEVTPPHSRNTATSAGIAVRNVAMHLMPLVNGAQRLGIPRGKWLPGRQLAR